MVTSWQDDIVAQARQAKQLRDQLEAATKSMNIIRETLLDSFAEWCRQHIGGHAAPNEEDLTEMREWVQEDALKRLEKKVGS